ncbi:MAG: MarR family transcriptional regulator [Lentimicrobiaceae bacterium]|jgi:DNA-binding Lrp family transcriptional regulator|nr:MarR family transcriptional regulator [Lentimicrobiaceae bacterium]MDD4596967.1 MarR family transcriptional regulator [Lentimicrobiaceae bacterium]MDY0024351.1 MarR family transcriptional regulator [Lentimicrobium sp.]HAH58661.1 MarR family transcriptional regulator [Bacteroidales bacterium]
METTERILQILKSAGKPLKSSEIAQAGGLDKKETDNAIKKLKKEERIHSPKNCFYEPK